MLAAARVHAQDEADPDKERTDQWVADGGTVEFEPLSLTIPEGESRIFRMRLTRPLPDDGQGNQVRGVVGHGGCRQRRGVARRRRPPLGRQRRR